MFIPYTYGTLLFFVFFTQSLTVHYYGITYLFMPIFTLGSLELIKYLYFKANLTAGSIFIVIMAILLSNTAVNSLILKPFI